MAALTTPTRRRSPGFVADAVGVGADGADADVEDFGDVHVAFADGDEGQDLLFAFGEDDLGAGVAIVAVLDDQVGQGG